VPISTVLTSFQKNVSFNKSKGSGQSPLEISLLKPLASAGGVVDVVWPRESAMTDVWLASFCQSVAIHAVFCKAHQFLLGKFRGGGLILLRFLN
jgi:hypothetical protein